MREVIVQGIGQTPVEEHWERSLRDLATEAGLAAMRDAGVDRIDAVFVGNMLSGQVARQENVGALVADWMGQRGAEGFKVEAACASGAAAFRAAYLAVASGALDAVLAVGVEKMTETSGAETTAALATAADADYEGMQGVTFVGLNALIMQRYLF
jgi:acetyl-CoA C-acetyltransferase